VPEGSSIYVSLAIFKPFIFSVYISVMDDAQPGIMEATISPTAPPTTQELIVVAAPGHDKLIRILSNTDYAPSALRESSARVSTLAYQVTEQQSLVSTLEARRLKEKTVHQKYRDSTVRRIVYNVSGRKDNFTDKVSREECQYLKTVEDHDDASRSLADLETQLAEAKEKHAGIEDVEAKRRSALQTLNELYDSIFAGPTPAFPEEDRAELAVAEAGHALEQQQTKLRKEKQALEVLELAGPVLNRLVANISDAIQGSAMVLAGVGHRPSYSEYHHKEQNYYKQNFAKITARATLEELQKLIQQARAMSSEVEDMAPVTIPKPSYRGDPVLNSFPEQRQSHQTLVRSRGQVLNEVEKLRGGLRKSRWRIEKMEGEVKRLQKELNEGRETLRKVRREVFDSVTGGLPVY
jgi:hypothetical protein